MTTETRTKERPILMCGEMVRATLDGRKTQARRVAKLDPRMMEDEAADWCPHGKLGDLLWVKETFASMQGVGIKYRADNPGAAKPSEHWDTPWKPSIFMPRWASRITLEIVSVRVEKLQDISEEDAKAEGVESRICGSANGYPVMGYRTGFVYVWQGIYSRSHPWGENPWVWKIEFKRV